MRESTLEAQPATSDRLYARFFSGLADETRLRIVRLLQGGPRTVGEIVAALALSQSRISNHLSCLKWCGYVQAERKGKTVEYRLAHESIGELIRLAQELVSRNAEHIAQCTHLDS